MTAAPDHDAPDYNALLRELRQARHISQCRAVDLERAQLELAATRARTAASASQQEAAVQHVVTLEQALLRLQAEHARLSALLSAPPVASLMTSEAGLQAEIALLAQHRDEARILRQSMSWRVTRPLRALRRPRRALRILLDRFVRSRSE
jgi:hypothetical protein